MKDIFILLITSFTIASLKFPLIISLTFSLKIVRFIWQSDTVELGTTGCNCRQPSIDSGPIQGYKKKVYSWKILTKRTSA